MNNIVKKAMEIDQYNNSLPDLEIGDIVSLFDVWDGEGEEPESSYSYQLTDMDWINYVFTVLDDGDLEITNIVLL